VSLAVLSLAISGDSVILAFRYSRFVAYSFHSNVF
jgi:hypothetical protein